MDISYFTCNFLVFYLQFFSNLLLLLNAFHCIVSEKFFSLPLVGWLDLLLLDC